MQVELTKKQYMLLLDLVYLGDWMLASYVAGEKPGYGEYEELQRHLYSLAKNFGCGDLAEYDKEDQGYYPALRLEDKNANAILQYNDYIFWEELISRLAERDFVKMHGEGKVKKMPKEDLFKGIGALEMEYAGEFQKNGIENLSVLKILQK